jgi:hypothetical protein
MGEASDLDEYLSVFDRDPIRGYGLLSRQATDLPRSDVETGAMGRTLDVVSVEFAVAEFDLLVATDVADGEQAIVAQPDQADRNAVGLDPGQ